MVVLIFFLLKKDYVKAYTLLTLSYRIIFVAWQTKLIILIENLGILSFPVYTFSHFVGLYIALFFNIVWLYFRANSVGIQHFVLFNFFFTAE